MKPQQPQQQQALMLLQRWSALAASASVKERALQVGICMMHAESHQAGMVSSEAAHTEVQHSVSFLTHLYGMHGDGSAHKSTPHAVACITTTALAAGLVEQGPTAGLHTPPTTLGTTARANKVGRQLPNLPTGPPSPGV